MDKWERILKPENVIVGLRAQRNLDAIRELASLFENDSAEIGRAHV